MDRTLPYYDTNSSPENHAEPGSVLSSDVLQEIFGQHNQHREPQQKLHELVFTNIFESATSKASTLKLSDESKLEQPAPVKAEQGSSEHLSRTVSEKTTPTSAEVYADWYTGMKSGTHSFDKLLRLANQYIDSASGSESDSRQFKAVKQWLKHQEERPSVTISLAEFDGKTTKPTPEEIGIKIAKALGFTETEMYMYAVLHGDKTVGAAFYKAVSPDAMNILMEQANSNHLRLVNIGDLDAGALTGMRQWLKDQHPGSGLPDIPTPQDRERTAFEAILIHLYNPAANAAGMGMATIGDIVQGAGLPLHLVTERTFLDRFGEYLREKGHGLPMMDLYTKEERRDLFVCIANMYGSALGSSAPMLVTGGASSIAGLSPRAALVASELMGASGGAGQVYDSALQVQARAIAREEVSQGITKPEDLDARAKAIRQGDVPLAEKR